MKDMRSILMNQDAGLVVMIVGIPANVRTLIAEYDFFVRTSGEAFGEYASSEPGANYQVIKH